APPSLSRQTLWQPGSIRSQVRAIRIGGRQGGERAERLLPARQRKLGAARRPERYRQAVAAAGEREPQRRLQAGVGQGLPHLLTREDHALADLEDCVS